MLSRKMIYKLASSGTYAIAPSLRSTEPDANPVYPKRRHKQVSDRGRV